ncbi:MAG: biosynthetic-type acetolactate synthase large subunit [Schwartzia sp.]|nr:biosynthetic-type acetolactate synthase large subunit [Schwartzia sp. (in: firmicutes)]MBO6211006.1 biosynthetic-type acetolactate synthase large subunit [Schwartzia sp. (in: firmicutes)]
MKLRINGAQAVLEGLKQEGVDVIFGYPGGVVLPLYDEIYKMKFPHILVRHEQGAALAADGYARATGEVGVCLSTSGPGCTNLVTGIATAYMDSIPLVCFTGQVATSVIGKDSFQEADICGITTPITKHNYLVKKPQDLLRTIKEAFFIARTGRPGPVVVDIATDVFRAEMDFDYPEDVHLKGYSGLFSGEEKAIDAVMDALSKAERPLAFIGGGVTLADEADDLRVVLKKLGIPVCSTLMGLGCVEPDTESYLGMAGMHGSYAANMAIMGCDLLLGIGVRFDDRVTGIVKEFAPEAKIVHFDIDAAELNKNVRVDVPVLGDLNWSLPIFAKKLAAKGEDFPAKFAAWREKITAMHKEHPFSYQKRDGFIMPQQLIETVRHLMDDDTIFVTDVGQHQMWAAQFCNVSRPRHFLTSGGLGTMGYGLPAAIGAKIGQPDKKVVLFTGDGSIMMNCQELATASDYGVDVKIVVVHNHLLGMVAQWQRMFYNRHYSESKLNGKTDLVKLAEAMGVAGVRIEKPEEMETKLAEALSRKGTTLIDVMVPEDADVLPMVPGGKRLDDMILEKEAAK